MAKEVGNLNVNTIGLAACDNGNAGSYYIDDNMFIFINTKTFGPSSLGIGNPYRVEEGRVIMVTNGSVDMYINLEEYHICSQTVLVFLPDTIFEIKGYSGNLNLQFFSFRDLPVMPATHKAIVMPLDEDKWKLTTEYFNLIWHEVHQSPVLHDVTKYLQTACLLELKRWNEKEEVRVKDKLTRQQRILHNFLDLVTKDGFRHRKVDYYASKLCLTPNYLSNVVKGESGMTVMQWINRYAIQQVKVMLKYSDLSISDIADRINIDNPSFFSKFFKRETGMTPNEYRNSDNR